MGGDEGAFFIDFKDMHAVYCLEKLDVNLVGAWALLQLHDADQTRELVGYLDPIRICKTQQTIDLHDDSTVLKDKSPKEKKEYIEKLRGNKSRDVAAYIGQAILSYQDKRCIMAPYNFT
ncbi:hypothetical protein E2562_008252 [Oryza meyeriana var. granulata]|uniref:Uncharacterized protein n=1 Tax=Oryza meyeriana var. granulata TaxID=110450 RepID=A0A6G1DG18_9ORYZ|nr:hypothetical protein E2562_008252 [Oryza meyeriana var. granulata]